MALQIAMQGMKPPSGSIHVLGRAHVVEHGQLETQPNGVLSLNPSL
jgi:hypothetical protein